MKRWPPQKKAILWQPKEHQAWGLVYLAEESLKSRAKWSNQPPACWSNGSKCILHTQKWCQLLLAIRAPIPNYINSTRGVKHFGWLSYCLIILSLICLYCFAFFFHLQVNSIFRFLFHILILTKSDTFSRKKNKDGSTLHNVGLKDAISFSIFRGKKCWSS